MSFETSIIHQDSQGRWVYQDPTLQIIQNIMNPRVEISCGILWKLSHIRAYIFEEFQKKIVSCGSDVNALKKLAVTENEENEESDVLLVRKFCERMNKILLATFPSDLEKSLNIYATKQENDQFRAQAIYAQTLPRLRRLSGKFTVTELSFLE